MTDDVVLDASAAAIALVETTDRGDALRARLNGVVVHAPHLVDAEVGSVLRRRCLAGTVPEWQAAEALRVLPVLVARRYPHEPLAARAWACGTTSPTTTPCTSPSPRGSTTRS